jgi:hypothetical protein
MHFAGALIDTIANVDEAVNRDLAEDDPVRRAWKTVIEPGTTYLERRVASLRAQANAAASGSSS